MSEFGAAATLEVEVDARSLREAQAEIESELGGTSVGVGGGGQTAMADGGFGSIDSLLSAQLETLDEIHEELKKMGVSGGSGGSGGGGGGGGGLLGGLGFSELAAYRLGGGGGMLGGLASRAIPSTMLGGGLAGLTGGLAGVNALDRMGVMQDTENFGRSLGQDAPGWMREGSNFLPGASIGAATPGIAQAVFGGSQHGGDGTFFGNRMNGLERAGEDFSTIWERRADAVGMTANEEFADRTSDSALSSRMADIATGEAMSDPSRDPRTNRSDIRALASQGDTLAESRDLARNAARFGAQTSPVQGRSPMSTAEVQRRARQGRADDSPAPSRGRNPAAERSQSAEIRVEPRINVQVQDLNRLRQRLQGDVIDQVMRQIQRQFDIGGV